jgi:hypothetical protein
MLPEPANPNQPGEKGGDVGGIWRWLGRQVGYVRAAIRTDVAAPTAQEQATVFRQQHVQEQSLGGQPPVTLRRTTVDEVIVEPPATRQ